MRTPLPVPWVVSLQPAPTTWWLFQVHAFRRVACAPLCDDPVLVSFCGMVIGHASGSTLKQYAAA